MISSHCSLKIVSITVRYMLFWLVTVRDKTAKSEIAVLSVAIISGTWEQILCLKILFTSVYSMRVMYVPGDLLYSV